MEKGPPSAEALNIWKYRSASEEAFGEEDVEKENAEGEEEEEENATVPPDMLSQENCRWEKREEESKI